MRDTWAIVQDRVQALDLLYKRMDATEEMLYMKDFKLRDFEDTHDLSNVINVTGNRAATYGHRVVENLASYKWQTVVEGNITQKEAATIEEFLDASLAQTNIFLSENSEDVPDLYTFWAKHICNRGRIGVHWMAWVEDGEYKIHCVPLDMRWTPYVKGRWICPIYFRKKDDLEEELEGYEKRAKDGGGDFQKVTLPTTGEIEVRDFWNTKKNELWVTSKLVYSQKNSFGRLPFVTVVAPSGNMFRSKGFAEHEGEDIYFLVKKLDKELNRMLSIEQTIGMDIRYPAMTQSRENFDSRPADHVPETGEVGVVRKGEEFQLVPRGDLNKASQAARTDVLRMIDEGAPMAPRAFLQPPSAVEVATEVELLNQLFQSRVTALQMGLSQLYRLMIEMAIIAGKDAGNEIEMGSRRKRKHFRVVQLKDPEDYEISCRLMLKNTKLEIVNEARAMAMWGRAPTAYILRDVLMVQDPDAWMRELELEQARKADPALALFEMGMRYAEEAESIENDEDADIKNFQSMMLIERGIAMVKQRMMPPLTPPSEKVTEPIVQEQRGSVQSLMPLLGPVTGGGGGRPPKGTEAVE